MEAPNIGHHFIKADSISLVKHSQPNTVRVTTIHQGQFLIRVKA